MATDLDAIQRDWDEGHTGDCWLTCDKCRRVRDSVPWLLAELRTAQYALAHIIGVSAVRAMSGRELREICADALDSHATKPAEAGSSSAAVPDEGSTQSTLHDPWDAPDEEPPVNDEGITLNPEGC